MITETSYEILIGWPYADPRWSINILRIYADNPSAANWVHAPKFWMVLQ